MKEVLALAYQDSALCKRHARRGRVRGIGDENALPDRGALGAFYVMNVQHLLRKSFVKHARLDLKRYLRSLEPVLQVGQSRLRTWRQINAVRQCQQPCTNQEN